MCRSANTRFVRLVKRLLRGGAGGGSAAALASTGPVVCAPESSPSTTTPKACRRRCRTLDGSCRCRESTTAVDGFPVVADCENSASPSVCRRVGADATRLTSNACIRRYHGCCNDRRTPSPSGLSGSLPSATQRLCCGCCDDGSSSESTAFVQRGSRQDAAKRRTDDDGDVREPRERRQYERVRSLTPSATDVCCWCCRRLNRSRHAGKRSSDSDDDADDVYRRLTATTELSDSISLSSSADASYTDDHLPLVVVRHI